MSNSLIQLLVLAGIAIFLILRLKNVLGSRDGYEQPKVESPRNSTHRFEVIDGNADQVDHDIIDHVEAGSPAAEALTSMKRTEPDFAVGEFLSGAKGAYEMILLAFERGDLSDVRPFLGDTVADAFQGVIDQRKAAGQTVEAQFLGTRETALSGASFDPDTAEGEISVRFVGEMITTIRDADGKVVEGDSKTPRKQRDVWTFARRMGQNDPNWQLVATG